jgi:hypothetical protein
MALGSIQPLTDMSMRNLSGGKGWQMHKADNLATICELIVKGKCGSLNISQPYEPSRPATGIFTFTLLFGDWILSLSSGKTYSVGHNQ